MNGEARQQARRRAAARGRFSAARRFVPCSARRR
jgi:hypothetical protein